MNNSENRAAFNTITDTELENISGGFGEVNPALATSGKNIKCPTCGNDKSSGFSSEVLRDPKTGSLEYSCNCGQHFICYKNRIILKNKWIEECRRKNYVYPFQ